jgi:hypothetical protein
VNRHAPTQAGRGALSYDSLAQWRAYLMGGHAGKCRGILYGPTTGPFQTDFFGFTDPIYLVDPALAGGLVFTSLKEAPSDNA